MSSDKLAPVTSLSPPLEELTMILLLQAHCSFVSANLLSSDLLSKWHWNNWTPQHGMHQTQQLRVQLQQVSPWGGGQLFYHGFPYIWKTKWKHPTWINWKRNSGMEHIWEACSWHGESLLLSSLEHHIPTEPSPGVWVLSSLCPWRDHPTNPK